MSNIATASFAAANSGYGFRSFYGSIFGHESIKKRYIIKGGPGTGKSSFMKKIGMTQEARGRDVEYYLCSSDPDSVDGIVIDGAIALMDGTAPHTVDTEIPGARDEIVDLLRFCDTKSLECRFDEIKSLSSAKSSCYKAAYGYLSLMQRTAELSEACVLPSLLEEKIKRSAASIVSRFPAGDGFSKRIAMRSSFGMKGRADLELYEKKAGRIYAVSDEYSFGYKYLEAIVELARERRQAVTLSYSYLDTDRLDAVMFDKTGDCFIVYDDPKTYCEYEFFKNVNLRRFIDLKKMGSEKRQSYKALKKVENEISELAKKELAMAGEYHFALEKIYISYMDFEALAVEAERLSDRISKIL